MKVSIQYHKDVPEKILVDDLKLQQILINLVNNAVKFTDQGEIRIEFKMSRPGFLSIQVQDSGIGMMPESVPMLFRPFYRENRVEVKTREGSGLGLALSRKLAKSLGGDLELVRSLLGKGTTFEVEIPISQPDKESHHGLLGRRIMVVDDSVDIQSLYRRRLEKEGAKVTVCTDGQKAVDALSQDPSYDLVLMDLSMPVLNGYAATTSLRKFGFQNRSLLSQLLAAKKKKNACAQVFPDLSAKAKSLKI